MDYAFSTRVDIEGSAFSQGDILLGDDDARSALSFISVDIIQTVPSRSVARYGLEMINHKYLLELEEHFYRHVLIYQKCTKNDVCMYLEKLVYRCADAGPIWNTILGYMEHEDCAWFYPGVGPLGPVIVGHEPKLSWYIESGRDLEGVSEPFDERIVVDITWLGEDGVQCYFRGYWYAVSCAYIEAALQKHDPYYRRHVYIPKVFRKEILEDCFRRTLAHCSQVSLEYRENYLMGHFEYDGQPILYNR